MRRKKEIPPELGPKRGWWMLPIRRNTACLQAMFLVFLLLGCGKDPRIGEDCSVDEECAPGKGVICVGADGLGFGVCGCRHEASWQVFLRKCVDDSFFEIKVGESEESEEEKKVAGKVSKKSAKVSGFGQSCQETSDCDGGTGLECVLRKCLCHPPGDTMVGWLWNKKHPGSECRTQFAKRYFGAKIVCDENQPKPGEYYIPPVAWWNEKKGRCLSLKERRSLPESGGATFTDWGEAIREIL